MSDLEFDRVVKSWERDPGEENFSRLITLAARRGEIPCTLPVSFVELQNPPGSRRMTFRGQVAWYLDSSNDRGRGGNGPSPNGSMPLKGRPVYNMILKVSEHVWVQFLTSGEAIKSMKLPEGLRRESPSIFRMSWNNPPSLPTFLGEYGVQGRATRVLCLPGGEPLFKPFPLVVHLEDALFTKIPVAHKEGRPHLYEDLGGMGRFPLDATYLDAIWVWRAAVNGYNDQVEKELRDRKKRLRAGLWETPEELEFVREKSLKGSRWRQNKKSNQVDLGPGWRSRWEALQEERAAKKERAAKIGTDNKK